MRNAELRPSVGPRQKPRGTARRSWGTIWHHVGGWGNGEHGKGMVCMVWLKISLLRRDARVASQRLRRERFFLPAGPPARAPPSRRVPARGRGRAARAAASPGRRTRRTEAPPRRLR